MGLGDELMVTAKAREMQKVDLRKVRAFYDGRPKWSEIFENNPRFAKPEELGDFQRLDARLNSLRPYIAGKTETCWTWREFSPEAGELYFDRAERDFAAHLEPGIVLAPVIKPKASPNKDWGWSRWQEVAEMLSSARVAFTQISPPWSKLLRGAQFVETRTFRLAAAVISKARLLVTTEGGLHHAAAALGIPALVIHGGYISPRVTGYEGHRTVFRDPGGQHPLGCGMRTYCQHCEQAMAEIRPNAIFAEIQAALEGECRAATPA